ncbi:DUF4352 domain-containing protein [Streptomyces sp. NPDC048565]|uniref:DUF4352 domain-containing protein n=1 Tax=Streptomyces sp. NPDC048565 TaxID=3155266 RepID=UPI00342C6748
MSQYTQPQQPQPQQPYAPGHAPGTHPARNGLGTAALVLGIIGTVSGLIPFFFWLAGILGLIALILGLAGRGRAKRGEATNKGVTTFGAALGLVSLILSVVGAVLTFKAVDDVVSDINKAVANSSASAKPASGENAADDKDGTDSEADALREGDSAAYDDGLEITVGAPAPYTTDGFTVGHTKGNSAYTVSIVIENKGKEKFDALLVSVDARAGEDGVNAEQIFDGKIGEGFSGTVLPGRKITAKYAFDAPADAKNLTVEVAPGFEWDASQWDLRL